MNTSRLFSKLFLGVLLTSSSAIYAQVKVGDNPGTINSSSALEVESATKGLLPPRVSIPDLTQAAPVTSPTEGLLVYNTNTTSGKGFVYWDGTMWRRFQQTAGSFNLSIYAAGSLYLGDVTGTSDGNHQVLPGSKGVSGVAWGGGWNTTTGSASWKVTFTTPVPAGKTYFVILTPRSSSNQAQPGNQADLDNDITPPIIVGKNPTDFTIFCQEYAGTSQQLLMDFVVLVEN
ncbi:hypothetical protein ACN9ML_11810 [Dyadobacter endophyticus]|uniref:hypothetical protein n=1 Tax=Dyadobacter endophyticus TaxID=1749036 RepID=UPI003CF28F66